jgi:hypothetical protein
MKQNLPQPERRNPMESIRKKLWSSVELAHYRNHLIIYTIAVTVGAVLAVLRNDARDPALWGIAAILLAIVFLPFLGYYLFHIVRIFRKSDQYVFCKVNLVNPSAGWFRGTMYFTILAEHETMRKIVVNTRPIFHTHGLIGPLFCDYVNQQITIAYNSETEVVVVIG